MMSDTTPVAPELATEPLPSSQDATDAKTAVGTLAADQANIEYTQAVRHKIVSTLVAKNTNGVPDEPDDRDLLMKALDGMSKTALGRMKIKSDEELARSNKAITGTMAVFLMELNNRKAMGAQGKIPTAHLPDIVQVPGEADQGTLPVKFADIVQKP